MRNSTIGRCLVRIRRTWHNLVFRGVAFATISLLAFGFAWDHSYQAQKQETRQNAEDRREYAEEKVAAYTFWLDLVTVALVLSTLGLWVVTWRGSVLRLAI
jgi:hypothetical protein